MNPADLKDDTYINVGKEVNDKDSKFTISDHVRISKYKNIFSKDYTSNQHKEDFAIKIVKNTVPWTYATSDLNGEGVIGTFYAKELQKQIKRNIEQKK